MIRLGVFLFVATALLASMSGVPATVILIALLILVAAAFTVGGHRLRCPKCGSRIKLGYTRCRCGHDVHAAK